MARNDIVLKKQHVIELYQHENPRSSSELDDFVARASAETGIEPHIIRKWVWDFARGYVLEFELGVRSHAQRMAEAFGASMDRAYKAVLDALEASDERPLTTKNGTVVVDSDGNPVIHRRPLHNVRLEAAKEIFKVNGAYAPKQVEINGQVMHAHVSDSELVSKLEQLKRDLLGTTPEVAGVIDARAYPADAEVPKGLLPVADGGDQDAGRAGLAEPVQAVPEAEVSAARPRRARKRADHLHPEEPHNDG